MEKTIPPKPRSPRHVPPQPEQQPREPEAPRRSGPPFLDDEPSLPYLPIG